MDVKWPKLSRIEKTEVIKKIKSLGEMPLLYTILQHVIREDRKYDYTTKNSLDANKITLYDALLITANVAYNGDVRKFLQVWKDKFNKDKEDDQQR